MVAGGCGRLYNSWTRLRPLLLLGLVATLAAHSAKTLHRNLAWKDELSLFTAGIQVNSMCSLPTELKPEKTVKSLLLLRDQRPVFLGSVLSCAAGEPRERETV